MKLNPKKHQLFENMEFVTSIDTIIDNCWGYSNKLKIIHEVINMLIDEISNASEVVIYNQMKFAER